jgi:FkbM family methyltransferase
MFSKVYDITKTFIFHFFLVKRGKIKGASRFYIFKLLSGLYINTLLHPAKNRVITVNIMKYKVSAYSYGDLLYLFKEIFLCGDYYFESKNGNPRIVDCGANIGMSILYFKTLFPDCSIMAFEPNPFAYAVLKKNIEQNNLKDVHILNTALSDRSGSIEYFIGDNKGSLVGTIVKQKTGDNVISVRVEKLSDHIQNQTFDFIKIDIEGAESYVLKDLTEAGKVGNGDQYTVEFHHDIQKSNLASFLIPFEKLGFGYSLAAKMEEVGTSQNVLIKFSKH